MNRQKCVEFLQREYQTQAEAFADLIRVQARILKDRGEIFVGQYISVKDGFVLFKVRTSDKLPRKASFWTASYLVGEMAKYKNWGDLSWEELRAEHQGDCCDVFCAWLSRIKDDPDFYMLAFKGFESQLVERMKAEKRNPILAFGPKDPPLQYLDNLATLMSDNNSDALELEMLNYKTSGEHSLWSPSRVNADEDLNQLLQKTLLDHRLVAIQGPPGTGKTYRIAQFVASLLQEKKSVLATSLTNEALMVLASKAALELYLSQGFINKTSLSTDEATQLPKLLRNGQNECNPRKGHLSLATFYLTSEWAKERWFSPPFDYIIVDEASQAYLPMLVASLRLGNKVVWIGDQKQLAPIAQTNEDIVNKKDWLPIIKGFDTACNSLSMPSFMLGDTFRLNQRGAEFTSMFYDTLLRSVSKEQSIPIKCEFLPEAGGPSLVTLPLKLGDKIPQNALESIKDIVDSLQASAPKAEIAILSKFKDTVKTLQKLFAPQEDKRSNVKIETVDRIQGLTVDYTIFLIPNTSVGRSLEKELFNVATSRARYATIIIADTQIIKEQMPEEVRRFFLKLNEKRVVTFTPKEISSGSISLKILGKINLPESKKLSSKVSLSKEAVYILDTNVLIDCPDIIYRLGGAKVVVPTTVLEELDKLKVKVSLDQNRVREAIKNVHQAFTKYYSSMEAGDVSLLPKGFDKNNPDCLILSVALKYREAGLLPIMLTSDVNLQARACGLKIETYALKELQIENQ